jgi:hypothetical protein
MDIHSQRKARTMTANDGEQRREQMPPEDQVPPIASPNAKATGADQPWIRRHDEYV